MAQKVPKDDPRYQPTNAELESDVIIPATPDDLLRAAMGRHPRGPQRPRSARRIHRTRLTRREAGGIPNGHYSI